MDLAGSLCVRTFLAVHPSDHPRDSLWLFLRLAALPLSMDHSHSLHETQALVLTELPLALFHPPLLPPHYFLL